MIAKQVIKKNVSYIDNPIPARISYKNKDFTIDGINFNINYTVASVNLDSVNVFDINKTYLISFVLKKKDYTQEIAVKLIDSDWEIKDSLKNEQLINYVPIQIPISTGDNDTVTEKYTFVFKPNFKTFSQIIFQSLGDYAISENQNRIVDIDSISIQEIKTENVLSAEECAKIKEFGIQAPPGFLFTINGEGFHIGRTGMFYLAESDFIFESIGICDNTLPFIIDYKIEN